MGIWIVIAVVLFSVGSIMALKPSGVEQRVDKLRMTARQLDLNPKLVACPDWIKGKNEEYGKGMIAQYGMIFDELSLPYTRYQILDGEWRPLIQSQSHDGQHGSSQHNDIKANFVLDKTPVNLPKSIQPFVKGLQTKANSIVIFWEDMAYARLSSNPNYDDKHIEADLQSLKAQLTVWVNAFGK